MTKNLLFGLTTPELRRLLQVHGIPSYRGTQISYWIYRRQVDDFQSMTDLPEKLRSYLQQNYSIGRGIIENRQISSDGTIKLLIRLADNKRIEAVGLPYLKRYTCCVSTQVGCPIGCIFCATGRSGFQRNLSSAEIVSQILEVNSVLRVKMKPDNNSSQNISNVVFMGMGEPLLNYENTMLAINLIRHEIGIGSRHITLSTVGYVPGIKRLAQENLQITLAISLHAASNAIRNYLIPSMRKWALKEIIATCKDYIQKTGRKITFEYCLIDGINDEAEQAIKLASLLKGLNCKVNLIPYNKVTGLKFKKSDIRSREHFSHILCHEGITVTSRIARGADIDAACGQLSIKKI